MVGTIEINQVYRDAMRDTGIASNLEEEKIFSLPINALIGQKQPHHFDDILQTLKAKSEKIFDGEMSIRTLPTYLLQIFCKTILNFKVIVRSTIDPDNISGELEN